MPTVANMPGADVYVTFPSGKTKVIFMPRLLVQTQNAEFKAQRGMFLPNVGKLRPTLKKLREEYEIPVEQSRTWKQMAVLLRKFYMDLSKQIKENQ